MHIAIMPARGGSKRIKNKNITDFCGRPLMAHALEAASASGLFDKIHVSTEDAQIADVAAKLGFAPDFMRDAALADDYTPLLPVLRWVLSRYVERGERYDTVCLLMPTAPLIEASDLQAAHALYEQHQGRRPVMAISSYPVPVEWAFHRRPDGSLIAVQPGMSEVRSQDLIPAFYDTGTFIFFPGAMLADHAGQTPEYLGWPLARHKAIDIDEPADLRMAEVIYRGLRTNRPAP